MNKKILVISYCFPPQSDVGGLKAFGYSKYLPEFGWKSYVISVKNPDRNDGMPGRSDLADGMQEVFYTFSLLNPGFLLGKLNGLLSRLLKLFGVELQKPFLKDLFCIPDEFMGWIPLAFFKAMHLIRKNDIDVIYVSCSPLSSAIIGAMLKYFTRKPLILEFRDAFSPFFAELGKSDNYYRRMPKYQILKRMERGWLKYADAFIVTAEETKEVYLKEFPFLKEKIHLVYNGFFEDCFMVDADPFREFTITYSGNFYNNLANPDYFFRALHKIFSENPELKGKISFLYVGVFAPRIAELIKRYDLHHASRCTGYVDRQSSVKYIMQSSLLLVKTIQPMISTKIFEGLAAGTPLLATVEEGEVASMIRKYSHAQYYIIKPDDVDGIAGAILDAYERWGKNELNRKINPDFCRDFNKQAVTRRFVDILNAPALFLVKNKIKK